MNVLQKGTLTIVAATLVTSAMILFTGNTIADSGSRTTSEVSSSANTENINDKAVADVRGVQVVKARIAVTPEKKEGVVKANVLPPPGPFSVASPVNKGPVISNKTKSLSAPVPPQAPVKDRAEKQAISEVSSKPNVPEIVVKKPDLKVIKPTIPEQPSTKDIMAKELAGNVKPEFKRIRPSIPFTSSKLPNKPTMTQVVPKLPAMEKPAPVVNSQIVMPGAPQHMVSPPQLMKSIEQPIWMQKKPVSRPVRPPALQSHPGKIPPTPNRPGNKSVVRSAQQYIYVPVPRYKNNYVKPQVPKYRRGYYYAPRPDLWVPPGNAGEMTGNNPSSLNIPKLNKGVNK